ncbi:MAG: DNA repair protein RadC [Saprospiraceae bacterium]
MKVYEKPAFSIKNWAEEDRPREKLLLKGKSHLTDAELMAIILGTGTKVESAVGLSKRVLSHVHNDLNELGKMTPSELMNIKGIGQAKAVSIIAALELGRRRQMADIREKPKITGSLDAYKIIAPLLLDLPHEEFWILLLNRANRVLGKEMISRGGVTGTVADAKIIFRKALEGKATSIILFHNHPSGNLRPSQADIDLTKKLKEAGNNLEISVLDHLIIAERGYYSFADEGRI